MDKLQIFSNQEFGKVRTVIRNNEPWFIGKDVAIAIGYSNPSDAIIVHVDDEDKMQISFHDLQKIGLSDFGTKGTNLINESGMYSLIFGSQLENAKKFKHWVTSEVLPTIRKTGQYQLTEFPQKASSIGEIVQLGKLVKELMKDQDATPYQVAEVVMDTLNKFGLNLNNNLLLPAKLEKLKDDELDMIEFAATFPNSSYQDYLLYRTITKN